MKKNSLENHAIFTRSFLSLQYFFLHSDSFLLRHIKNLWNSFLIHYKKKPGKHTSFLGHWKSQCMEPTITFHYYVILWNYQIRPCLFFYGPSLNLIRRQTPTLYHHIDLQKTRLSFIIVNQLKLCNYFCISVPLPV